MSTFRRTAFSGVLVVLASGAVALATAPLGAAANVSVGLPLDQFRWMTTANGLVFLTGGDSDGVVVRNADGSANSVIDEPTPNGLAAAADGATVYVALGAAHAIAAIDTTTLAETARFDTGTPSCPSTLAVAGSNLFYGDGCTSPDSTIGVVDLSQPTPVVHAAAATGFTAAPLLAASSALAGRIFAGVPGSSTATVSAYDVSGTTLTPGETVDAGENLADLAITADGADLVTAAGYPYHHSRYHTADLTADGTYSSGAYPNAVATDPAGWVAAGVNGVGSPDIYVYDPSSTFVRDYDFGSTADFAPHGLAFGPAALYAVTVGQTGDVTLRVLRDARVYPTTASLVAPAAAPRARMLTLSGRLASPGTTMSGLTVTVTKSDLRGRHVLAAVTTGPTGAFTIHDTPAVGGTNTYTITYAGSATRAAVTRSVRVAVSRVSPSMSLVTNHASYAYGQRQYVTVHLGPTYVNRTVTITDREYGWSGPRVVRTARVDSHGNLATSFVAHRNVTIVAKFAGDDRYAPRSIVARRAVRAYIYTAIAGSYGRSGKYRLFHASKGGGVAVRVLPGKAGEAVVFRLEWLRSGRWRTVDSATVDLNANGVAAVGFTGRTNTPFRIRGEFPRDAANAGVSAHWWYVQFR